LAYNLSANHPEGIVLMTGTMNNLVADYPNWLKDNMAIQKLDAMWWEITTPCLDRRNDFLQIYVRKDPNGFFITDDGYIIDDLACSGYEFDTIKRKFC
jgi:hypothetical protein